MIKNMYGPSASAQKLLLAFFPAHELIHGVQDALELHHTVAQFALPTGRWAVS